jgi:hypothetical protein
MKTGQLLMQYDFTWLVMRLTPAEKRATLASELAYFFPPQQALSFLFFSAERESTSSVSDGCLPACSRGFTLRSVCRAASAIHGAFGGVCVFVAAYSMPTDVAACPAVDADRSLLASAQLLRHLGNLPIYCFDQGPLPANLD